MTEDRVIIFSSDGSDDIEQLYNSDICVDLRSCLLLVVYVYLSFEIICHGISHHSIMSPHFTFSVLFEVSSHSFMILSSNFTKVDGSCVQVIKRIQKGEKFVHLIILTVACVTVICVASHVANVLVS